MNFNQQCFNTQEIPAKQMMSKLREESQENDLKSNSCSELSSKVFATHNVVKTFLSNKAESHIGAPMTSLAETCGTESDTLCEEQQIITIQDNGETVGESNCRNNHKIQAEEMIKKLNHPQELTILQKYLVP